MKIPAIPYVSPSLRFDQDARVVVVEYRNAETGKVARQIPSEEAVRRAATEGAGPPAAAAAEGEAAEPGAAPAAAAPRISIDV